MPVGWLLDRAGTRWVLTGLTLSLGGVVLAMSALPAGGVWLPLFLLVLLTRGLGQSGLSVASLALLGRSSSRHRGVAVGVYSFLVAVGFTAAFSLIKHALEAWHAGWRELWAGVGWSLVALAAVLAFAVAPPAEERSAAPAGDDGLSLGQALATPAFWVFGLGTSLYGLISSGLSLFNQAILQERGFPREVFLTITAYGPLVGLVANLAGGCLAQRWSLRGLLAVALGLLGAALAAFPLVTSLAQVYLYAGVMAVAGGLVTVIFFAAWLSLFGSAHLGQVQGAAQMITVLASALGPLLVAFAQDRWGSYTPLMQTFAGAALLFAAAAWVVPLPRRRPGAADADR
ncbi:MAG: MFS transporter [Gemmataceae bacterium]